MSSRRYKLALAAASATALLGGATLLAAQPSWETGERRRAVSDWLVEDVMDPGHGWSVGMSREADEYSLGYYIHLNALEAPPVELYQVVRLSCGRSSGASIGDRAYGDRDQVRAQLVGYLVECEMTPEEAEEAVQGFERAFALTAEWADERAAEMAASRAAAASEGEMSADMGAMEAIDINAPDMNMTEMDMNAADMDMMTDMNATMDMNWTGDPDPSTNALAPQ